MAKDGSRILALDGVRGVAIVLVLFHHFAQPLPLPEFAVRLASASAAGVDLFFVLSGFLITGILLNSKGSPAYFRSFYMRRTLRIFPLYYAVIAASVVFAASVPASRELLHRQAWLWLYGTNVKMYLAHDWVFQFGNLDLRHLWSLAVEEHFYLIWPALVLVSSPRRLVATCLLILFIAPIIRFAILARGNWVGAYVFTLCRIDSMAAGALLATLGRSKKGHVLLRRALPVLGVLALPIILQVNIRGGFRIYSIYYSSLAAFFTTVVWVGAYCPPTTILGRLLRARILVSLGRYSYGLYVFHFIVRGFLPLDFFKAYFPNLPASVLFVIIGMTTSIVLSVASFHLYEAQFLRLKRFFPPSGLSAA